MRARMPTSGWIRKISTSFPRRIDCWKPKGPIPSYRDIEPRQPTGFCADPASELRETLCTSREKPRMCGSEASAPEHSRKRPSAAAAAAWEHTIAPDSCMSIAATCELGADSQLLQYLTVTILPLQAKLWADRSVAFHQILEACQLFRAHRTPGMNFPRGNSYFRTHAEFSAVRELRGRIAHQNC